MRKKFLFWFSGILILLYIGISYIFSSMIIGTWHRGLEDPSVLGERYGEMKEVNFQTDDGLMLKGWLFENPNDSVDCGVILTHGHNNNRYSMRFWMPYFWVRGCDVMMYDHRAHGESEGKYGTFGVLESGDLLKAHELFRQITDLKNEEIGWVGASWGAATVLQAGAQIDDLAFILADSPFKDLDAAAMERGERQFGSWIRVFTPMIYWLVEWRADFEVSETSSLEKARDIQVPVLLIHSQTDQATSSRQSVEIAAAMNPDILTFHHTSWGSLHCADVQDFPDRYGWLIDEFLKEYEVKAFIIQSPH